jgi:hypothetical protein
METVVFTDRPAGAAIMTLGGILLFIIGTKPYGIFMFISTPSYKKCPFAEGAR